MPFLDMEPDIFKAVPRHISSPAATIFAYQPITAVTSIYSMRGIYFKKAHIRIARLNSPNIVRYIIIMTIKTIE